MFHLLSSGCKSDLLSVEVGRCIALRDTQRIATCTFQFRMTPPALVRESTALLRESREDDCQNRMPEVIHLAPSFHVNSPEKPVIIEDITGYEILKGRYNIFVGRDEASREASLLFGERVDATFPCYDNNTPLSSEQSTITDKHGEKNVVTQALSILRSSSNLSEITLLEETEEAAPAEFEHIRLSL